MMKKKRGGNVLRIYNTDLNTNEFKRIDHFEMGCWINLTAPTDAELIEVSNSLGIKKNFIMSILDNDEKPRIDEEDGCKMLLLDVPIRHIKNKREAIKTLPLGIIIVRNDYIITVCLQKYALLDEFSQGKVREFYTYKKSRFVIQMIYRIAVSYLKILK